MTIDLKSDHGLREASLSSLEQHRRHRHLDDWLRDLTAWLARVASADRQTFVSPQFQRELWDDDTISATGQGHVDVSRVVADETIAGRLWELKQEKLPEDRQARIEWLDAAWEEIVAAVKPLTKRWPRLKMYRVFASLWPAHFTTVAHYHKLLRLGRAMGLSRGLEHRTELHQRVLERLDEAGVAAKSQAERMTLPWVLFVHCVQEQGSDATEVAGDRPGETRLNPLPANRRRRGMTGIGGGLPSVLGMLEFAKDGCKREDFLDHIHSLNPKHHQDTIRTNLNCLMAEWGALRAEGDELKLTERGEALLESGDPDEVADWLLTRILGFDNLLVMLRDGPESQAQVVDRLQGVNPGWTTNFAPTVLLNWARYLGLLESEAGKKIKLTERGEEWLGRIHWTPETLAPVTAVPGGKELPAAIGQTGGSLRESLPSAATIAASFPQDIVFPPQLIARLHTGLWSHPRRHFAVLTGLSGAGKTQLAQCYAKGLRAEGERAEAVKIVPVQPGWHDPSSLLGYINPIQNEVYMRTSFLDFLLQASADPERPYTVVLDEMNLSHPEQYLAPLLSAMETGAYIELHAQGDEVGGVPARIPYPENLVLIGTVNMDETTHGLSDKVLDRASVIEFWDIDVDSYPGWKSTRLNASVAAAVREALGTLVGLLRPARLHFGWRTIGDVIGYVETATDGDAFPSHVALDHAIYSKVLPKLRGEDTKRLREALEGVKGALITRKLSDSARKVTELVDDLHHHGSARFWR